jgi:hypothetical protein
MPFPNIEEHISAGSSAEGALKLHSMVLMQVAFLFRFGMEVRKASCVSDHGCVRKPMAVHCAPGPVNTCGVVGRHGFKKVKYGRG